MSRTAIKLYYFPIKARSYATQVVARAGDVPLEHITDFEFTEFQKTKLPFGQVPYMEHDDVKMAHSNAILRYVGKLAGTEGVANQHYLSEMLIEEADDILKVLLKTNSSTDKASAYSDFFQVRLPKHLVNIEKLAPQFSTVSKRLTGEYALVCILDIILNLDSTVLDMFPLTKEFVVKTCALPEFDGPRDLQMYFSL